MPYRILGWLMLGAGCILGFSGTVPGIALGVVFGVIGGVLGYLGKSRKKDLTGS